MFIKITISKKGTTTTQETLNCESLTIGYSGKDEITVSFVNTPQEGNKAPKTTKFKIDKKKGESLTLSAPDTWR